jgi:hypothetical protein
MCQLGPAKNYFLAFVATRDNFVRGKKYLSFQKRALEEAADSNVICLFCIPFPQFPIHLLPARNPGWLELPQLPSDFEEEIKYGPKERMKEPSP